MTENSNKSFDKLCASGIDADEAFEMLKTVFNSEIIKKGDMAMFVGTCYFINEESTIKYYAKQETDEASVKNYIEEGLVIIGKPKKTPGTEIHLDDDGRFWLAE